ncbi:MAG: hypothetical protein LBC51_09365 [Treponema sp.]|jgi:hypothetical protein|nr:hypothetical protein [Treponema sp.]
MCYHAPLGLFLGRQREYPLFLWIYFFCLERGIPIYDRISMPHPRTLRIRFRHERSKRWGKPEFVHGLECLRAIADAPPEKIQDLLHSAFATRSPLECYFQRDYSVGDGRI